ncbi:MAG TPA: hypothetical protein QF624_10140 [Dehalococcoidia bacterium]|nr:hypothetical protein [Dehalococcoidia bacterium]
MALAASGERIEQWLRRHRMSLVRAVLDQRRLRNFGAHGLAVFAEGVTTPDVGGVRSPLETAPVIGAFTSSRELALLSRIPD